MIAEGLATSSNTVWELREHLIKALCFNNVAYSTSSGTSFTETGTLGNIPEAALSLIHEMLPVFDAAHPLQSLNPTSGQTIVDDSISSQILIGSPFVDVCLNLICMSPALDQLPPLTLKSLMETLGIIIYKHDFDRGFLRSFHPTLRKAVTRILEVMLNDISYSTLR